jgi:DNA-binding NarL/FixJ family response regulator
MGIHKPSPGEANPRCTITLETAKLVKTKIESGESNKSIARELNLSYYVVTNIKYGKA